MSAIGPALGSDPHLFVSAMATYVGLDPVHDINWVISDITPIELFAEGKIDAFLGFALEAQELRARKLGHVVVSGNFGSALVAVLLLHAGRPARTMSSAIRSRPSASCARYSRAPTSAFPIRRWLRASWSMAGTPTTTTMRCARSPNFRTPNGANSIPRIRSGFSRCACMKPGIVKSSPQKIIANGTDWRFLNELKRELKT